MYKKGVMKIILAGEVEVNKETFERKMKKEFLKKCAKKWDETPSRFIKF